MNDKNVRNFTLTAMFLAIMIILAVTPLVLFRLVQLMLRRCIFQ